MLDKKKKRSKQPLVYKYVVSTTGAPIPAGWIRCQGGSLTRAMAKATSLFGHLIHERVLYVGVIEEDGGIRVVAMKQNRPGQKWEKIDADL